MQLQAFNIPYYIYIPYRDLRTYQYTVKIEQELVIHNLQFKFRKNSVPELTKKNNLQGQVNYS